MRDEPTHEKPQKPTIRIPTQDLVTFFRAYQRVGVSPVHVMYHYVQREGEPSGAEITELARRMIKLEQGPGYRIH